MFDRFTEESKRLMNAARQESLRLRHTYLAPEHMFLAMLATPEGLAPRILRELSCDPNAMREDVERLVLPDTTTNSREARIPFTASAKKVLEFTIGDSVAFGHARIGTGHILAGLLAVHDSLPARVLATHRVTLDDVRTKLIAHGGWDSPAEPVYPDTGRRMHVLRQAVAVLREVGEVDLANRVERVERDLS